MQVGSFALFGRTLFHSWKLLGSRRPALFCGVVGKLEDLRCQMVAFELPERMVLACSADLEQACHLKVFCGSLLVQLQ